MEEIINNRLFKSILSKIPLIALGIITITTNYYYFYNSSYNKIYELLSYCTGFSLMSLLPYFYIVYKHKFCSYSKFAIWGLLFYVLFNTFWLILEYFFNVNGGLYKQIIESISITIPFLMACFYLIKKYINNE